VFQQCDPANASLKVKFDLRQFHRLSGLSLVLKNQDCPKALRVWLRYTPDKQPIFVVHFMCFDNRCYSVQDQQLRRYWGEVAKGDFRIYNFHNLVLEYLQKYLFFLVFYINWDFLGCLSPIPSG
jgi:hypothetical protein